MAEARQGLRCRLFQQGGGKIMRSEDEATRRCVALLVGSGISAGLAIGALRFNSMPWLIYPSIPGFSLFLAALWFTEVHWGDHQFLARCLIVTGDAAFYGGACYLLLRAWSKRGK